jgi:21S rRNA (uridine2791-2'-O)-methyltransferase
MMSNVGQFQGFAPGSWSQVALERTKPTGQVIGIDVLPAQPPGGISAIQGNFLSPAVQSVVKDFIRDSHRRRVAAREQERGKERGPQPSEEEEDGEIAVEERPGYIDMEKAAVQNAEGGGEEESADGGKPLVDV